jgi:hypothetical protein
MQHQGVLTKLHRENSLGGVEGEKPPCSPTKPLSGSVLTAFDGTFYEKAQRRRRDMS